MNVHVLFGKTTQHTITWLYDPFGGIRGMTADATRLWSITCSIVHILFPRSSSGAPKKNNQPLISIFWCCDRSNLSPSKTSTGCNQIEQQNPHIWLEIPITSPLYPNRIGVIIINKPSVIRYCPHRSCHRFDGYRMLFSEQLPLAASPMMVSYILFAHKQGPKV